MVKEIKIKIPTPDDIVSEEFAEHLANAYKELLLAAKCLIDSQIKRVEEKSKNPKELKKIEIN
ncbi:MAG: hypothetical protein DSY33_05580 [Archaeoglobus sp.]|jgi:hypothetical protein|nr:MAG: hypothetical protein DSY33_05580 [Archaeoglobus sp.]